MNMNTEKFVLFDGDETEKEFLKKCYQQWENALEYEDPQKTLMISSAFSEIRHRIEEIENREQE